jgi:hypothetical protein
MNIQAINTAILQGSFTNDQLNSIADAVRFARSQITRRNTGSFVIGTRVKFYNRKTGVTYTGTVNKVKLKNILVDTDVGVRYNVPAAMLETV